MTILWCGGEDIDFNGGNISIDTTSTYYRTAWSRCAINMYRTPLIYTPTLSSPVTSFWFSTIFYFNYLSVSFELMPLVQFESQNKTGYLQIQLVTSTKDFRINRNGTIISSASSGIVTDKLYKIDICVSDFNQENTGNIKVYLDGELKLDYTETLYSGTLDSIDRCRFYGDLYYASWYISELIWADDDTRLKNLKTLVPNAAGDTSEWTGAYTDINEIVYSSNTFLTTEDPNKLNLVGLSNLGLTLYAVKAVKVFSFVSPAFNGIGLKIGIKTNNTLYLDSIKQPTWTEQLENIYNVNPYTSLPFTIGEVDALQVAIESEEVEA
jgi:hypothetical protein